MRKILVLLVATLCFQNILYAQLVTELSKVASVGGSYRVLDTPSCFISIITAGEMAASKHFDVGIFSGNAGFLDTSLSNLTSIAPITGIDSVCVGAHTTLYSATWGGKYSSGDTTVAIIDRTTGVVSGLATGHVTMSYTLGCSEPVVYNVRVMRIPALVTGPTQICIGSPTSFSDSTIGGTWSCSTIGVAGLVSAGVVTGVSTGFVTLSYTNACGTASKSLTVVGPPAAISGISSICISGTSSLFDATVGGAWSSTSPGVASVNSSGTIMGGSAPGTTTISYTTTCGSATSVVSVYGTPAPISGPYAVCIGNTSLLSDVGPSGNWISSNPSVVSIGTTSGLMVGLSSGISNITYTTACGSTTSIITIMGAPADITGSGIVCAGGTITLADDAGSGTWSSSSVLAGISLTGIVTGNIAGIDTITYSTTCGSTSKAITVNGNPTSISGPSAVCLGGTVTFSDATPGGVWSCASTGIATISPVIGVFSGIGAGVLDITYTTLCGSATQTVTVNGSGPLGISGILSLCQGAITTLADATTGGEWTSDNSAVAVVSAAGIVNGIAGGSAHISYSTGCGVAATAVITVNPKPSVITGISSLCLGGSATLTDSIPGGLWSSSATGIVSVVSSSGVLNAVALGAATITYALGCGSQTVSLFVNSTAAAPITGSAEICSGFSTTMSDGVVGGTWSSSSPTVASIGLSTGIVSGISGGTTTLSYNTGCGLPATLTVTINSAPAPISGTELICLGSTATLSSATPGGTWLSGTTGIVSVGASDGIITGIHAGTATVTYNVAAGCGVATALVTVAAVPSAIVGVRSICSGALSVLTDSVAGGRWSSSGGGAATIDSLYGIVSGVSSGLITISYANTCGFATTIVTVNETPATISGIQSVCAGASVTLSESTSGGIWSTSSPALANIDPLSGVVSGVSGGVATIEYSNTCGSASYTVTVNSSIAISGINNFCVGDTTTLSDVVSGGTWETGSPTIASISSTGVVTGLNAGIVNIFYHSGTLCGDAHYSITVNGAPAPIYGASFLCSGTTITLTDAIPNGSWTSSSPGIASVNIATGVVYGLSAGVASLTYANGCMLPATKTLTVNPVPVAGLIAGGSSVCTGYTIALTDSIIGGTWNSNNTAIATVNSATGLVTGVSGGGIVISYTVANSCTTATTTKTVTVIPMPVSGTIVGLSAVCAGATVTLSETTAGGTWSSAASAVATVNPTTGVVGGISNGSTLISYTVTNVCGSARTTKTITVNSLPAISIIGVDSFCVSGFATLFGSPSAGIWSVSNNNAFASLSGILTGNYAGVDTVTYSFTNECGTAAANKIVTISPLPDAGVIDGLSGVCVGSVITLSESATGGTWASVFGDFTVSGGVLAGLISGTDTVKYTVANVCGTSQAKKMIIIYPAPDAGIVIGTDSVCTGDTILLMASASGGIWSSSNSKAGVSGGTVLGISTGLDTVFYSVSNSCGTDVAAKSIFVKSLPISGVLTGLGSICVPNSITLTDTVTGGVWSCSNPNAEVLNGIVTAVSSGADTVRYTVTNSCGTSVTSMNILLSSRPFPGKITGLDSVCVGASITLTDTVSGGAWSLSNNSASILFGIVTGNLAGLDTIRYTVANLCGTSFADTVIFVKPRAIASPISATQSGVCTDSIITLTDTSLGGIWSNANSALTSITSAGTVCLVRGLSDGLDTIIYTVVNSCDSAKAQFAVNVQSRLTPEIVGQTYACVGRFDTLAGVPSGGIWSVTNNNVTISGGVVAGVVSGLDTVIYTVSNACGTAEVIESIIVLSEIQCDASVNAMAQMATSIEVFPNPSDGFFKVQLSSSVPIHGYLVVSDLLGRNIERREIYGNTGVNNFEFSRYNPGVYFVKSILGNVEQRLLKVVVE